ncbi:hypothetical protein HII31_01675 [Pseudocercospora fuligena]|uniref:Uncharacterized protein n=1 Tax=Pseudocercospora fuligena TaxID=685502 RepID=A0A8H6VM89_9PEZI|nr:hypothetical protein HII31_01675 [Pseudocercospora fuligena]
MTEHQSPPAPQEDQKIFPFLNLPAELRNQIYDNVVADRNNGPRGNVLNAKRIALLATNQQVRKEFGSMLWPETNLSIQGFVAPGQLPSKARKMPGHVARQANSVTLILKTNETTLGTCRDATTLGTGRDAIRVYLKIEPKKGTFRLWAHIHTTRRPSWLRDEIEKYHAWKSMRTLHAWMTDRTSGLTMHPEPLEPGAMPYPGVYPQSMMTHKRHGRKKIYQYFGPSNLTLRQRLTVFFHAESHILLLKEQAVWKSIRAKIGDQKTDTLQDVAIVLGVFILLWISSFILGITSLPFVPLVAIPAIARVALEDLPWATRTWILLKLRWVWPTLFVVFTATLAFSAKAWSWWYIPELLVSFILALS